MVIQAIAAKSDITDALLSLFIPERQMQQRLLNLNPHSFRKMVTTLLEVNGRGYWETSESNLDKLRE
ncbi:MAG: hypothetical protein F6K35_51490, partial [Okeania sp. SIO2H7]|nr:hypothetical protein [Okeania sp. SIO2H7]